VTGIVAEREVRCGGTAGGPVRSVSFEASASIGEWGSG
jgi:hypothetical protein